MFRKKRSSSHLQPPVSQPTASAASAAAQAFVKKQLDDGKLSAGAAAAALRAHTPTPASPADLQTKRMIRRGSTSSTGSAAGSTRQPFGSTMQRRGSSGSMSSRTFRSPSPGGRNGTPPVPALPTDIPPLPAKSHMRTPSEEPPQRILSPPPQNNGRASSLDSSKWAAPIQQRSKLQTSGLEKVPEQGVAVSPGGTSRNINFSRPMSPPMSPASPVNGTSSVGTGRPRPASTMGLTAEQYKKLQQRQDAQQSQPTRQATTTKVVYNPASRSIEHQIVAIPPSSLKAPPTPIDMSPLHTPVPSAPPSPSSKKKKPMLDTQPGTPGQTRQQAPKAGAAAAQRAVSMNSLPAPSSAEIKSFQTRAASLLARPLTDTASISAQPMPRPRSAILGDTTPPKGSTMPNRNSAASNHTRTVSTPVSRSSAAPKPLARGDSVSPARSARFSDAPLLEVALHQPPPRSVSPVKSAMKGGQSPRTASPATSRTRDHSNHSDTRSSRSEESGPTSSRKKKSVRVSFEARPVMVGESAGESMDPSDTIMSPQYIKNLESGAVPDDSEDVGMGPRPVLPSFGSVRNQQRSADDVASKSEVSNNEPLVSTQDEGSLEDSKMVEVASPSTTETVPTPEIQASNLAVEDSQKDLAAPQIEVEPASPAPEAGGEIKKDPMDEAANEIDRIAKENAVKPGSLSQGQAKDVAEWASTRPKDDNYSDTDDGVDDDFSDATEDQAEVEATGGFASLDAILESPATESMAPVFPTTEAIARSPAIEEAATENPKSDAAAAPASAVESTPVPDEDWDTVRAYWSGLSDTKKKELELQANPHVDTATVPADDTPEAKPKAPAASEQKKATPVGDRERLPPWPDKQYQETVASKPKPKSALKQTAQPQPVNPVKTAASLAAKPKQQKQQPVDPTHMRKSMRTGGSLRTSMAERPVSMSAVQQPRAPSQTNSKRPKSTTVVPGVSPAALALAQSMNPRPVPVRRGSNDSSASESSFRKKRRGSDSTAGGSRYSFARSMRGGARAAPDDRPMSPPRPAKTRQPKKSTLRGSTSPPPTESKSGFMGFGKGKSKPAKAKGKSKGASGGSRFKSRFADSSDEDSDGADRGRFASRFKSRFDNSDDSSSEDDIGVLRAAPAKLTPVRGIPRAAGKQDGDSTELEDSDDDAKGPRSAVPGPASAKKRPGTPPASTALNFGNKTTAAKAAAPVSPTSPTSPTSPPPVVKLLAHPDEVANGKTTEGSALGAGTLRKDDENTSPVQKRRSFFHRREKSKDKTATIANDLSSSKWAPQDAAAAGPISPTTSPKGAQQAKPAPPSRPQTPSHMPKSLRANPPQKPTQQRSSSRSSFFRRSSSSAPTTPTAAPSNPGMTKDSFPFPPPPIPSKYAKLAGLSQAEAAAGAGGATATEEGRPNTSDGVSNKGSSTLLGVERPAIGNKRDSAMTAPSISGKSARLPVYSEKTGRKKKFGGLRRVFGLND